MRRRFGLFVTAAMVLGVLTGFILNQALSPAAVAAILRKEGFAKLPRRHSPK